MFIPVVIFFRCLSVHRTLMHFVSVTEESLTDSIPGRAGVADSNVVLGLVCKLWAAQVELS